MVFIKRPPDFISLYYTALYDILQFLQTVICAANPFFLPGVQRDKICPPGQVSFTNFMQTRFLFIGLMKTSHEFAFPFA